MGGRDARSRAGCAFGTERETEAVTLALRRVVNNARVAAGIRALGGSRLVDPQRVHDGPADG